MYTLLSFVYAISIVFCEELDDYVGGFAKIGQVPYVVYVRSGFSGCTGAIIEKDWILSAAHCFYKSGKAVSPESVQIVAGIVDYQVTNISSAQTSTAKELIINPWYQHNSIGKHDIALVKLQKQFTFNEYVNKTYVSGEEWPGNDPVKCVAAGFGRFDRKDGNKNSRLKLFEPYAEHGHYSCPCTRRFQKRRLVCLKPEQDIGVCSGDSGGALVCNKKAVGVAHMIMDKRSCSFKKSPKDFDCGKLDTIGIYMFICPYLDWMRESVSSVPSRPVSCKASPLLFSSAVSITTLFCVLVLKYF